MNEVVDSRQILAFVTIAIQGSLKAAAQRLHLTESALSHSLKNLEENLGVKLFERASKRLKLSEAGHIALEDAIEILDKMKFLRDRMQPETSMKQKTLTIVVAPSFLRFFCPQIVGSLRNAFGGCKININAGDRKFAMQALAKDEADFVVTIDPPTDESKYSIEPLFDDELSLLIGADHPLTKYTKVIPRQLAYEAIYLDSIQSHTTERVIRQIRNSGVHLQHVTETRNKESIFQMVAMGLGCSFQPAWICQNELTSGLIETRCVEDVNVSRTWSIVSSANRRLSPIDTAFIEFCHEAVSDNPHELKPSRLNNVNIAKAV
jgi:LysR family transcriptional regulator, low CO2-responsive transcriptional regulator